MWLPKPVWINDLVGEASFRIIKVKPALTRTKKKNKAGGGRGYINVRTNLCGANLKNFLENSREAVSIFNDL